MIAPVSITNGGVENTLEAYHTLHLQKIIYLRKGTTGQRPNFSKGMRTTPLKGKGA